MRILWLKSDLLLPLDKGGKLRTWHLMKHLARSHEITYLSFSDPGTPSAHVDGMSEVAQSVVTVERRDPIKRSPAFYLDVTRRLFDRLPYAVGKYRSSRYRQTLMRLLDSRVFDLIVCDFLPPVVNLPRRLPCPTVLFTHNVEAEIWRRHAETSDGAVRWLYRTQWRRMLRFEREALARFDGVLAVSDADRETFSRLYPGALRGSVDVIPTGVDTTFFAPAASPSTSPGLVFTGSMDWLPNEDAMLHFCRDVLPLVRTEVPDATLAIVGRAPTPPILRLAGPGITVTGRVDDVRPFLDAAAVFVVPLRIGGGTRLKIFEAMAMGKAVVSTTVGAEGLPVEHGRHLLIADEPASFAQAIVRLLRDVPQRRALEHAARALVLADHDWAAVARVLDTALHRIAQAPHPVAPSNVSRSSRNGAAVPSPVADPATSRGL